MCILQTSFKDNCNNQVGKHSAFNIMDMINEESEIIDELKQREDAYREKVIKTFFEYGKLKSIPSQRKKERIRVIVLSSFVQ